MADEPENSANSTNTKPYKTEQFDAFIATIKGGAVGHWIQIARVLGVDRDTINSWKALPQAQKAIKDAIDSTMEKMMEAGKDDWKMWESKMKMLGVSPVEKSETDITSGGKEIPILGGASVVKVAKDAIPTNDSDTETSSTS